MKIKEIEERSGMNRANIRFYEAEGLIAPARGANGYREYSDEDLAILHRIKLLRTLHISLEEIKTIANGEHSLPDALDAHLVTLEHDKTQIEQSQELCKMMREDNAQYETLDAQYYLDCLQKLSNQEHAEWKKDILPKVKEFERRFFARMFDLQLCSILWSAVLAIVLNISPSRDVPIMDTFDFFVELLILYLLEPILLSKFGTTPGKWILGLSVRDYDGQLLTVSAARARTWSVIWRGMGWGIPVYYWYRMGKCYWNPDQDFEWEQDSMLVLRDKKAGRIAAYLGACAVSFGVLVLVFAIALVPTHRGDLTVKEFCRNYNGYSDFHNFGYPDYLDDNGKWKEKDQTGNTTVVLSSHSRPDYRYECDEQGNLIAVEYEIDFVDETYGVAHGSNQVEMMFAMRSFIGAQKSCGIFLNQLEDTMNRISNHPEESFETELHGVRVTYTLKQSGWHWSEDLQYYFPLEDENSFYMKFRMEKVE